jgi:hypothetical protein
MSLRNKNRAAVLNQVKQWYNVRRFLREGGCSAREVADALLAFKSSCIVAFGGPARFTGNNRTYANGAVAYEVACRKCKRSYWVTALPYALCPDCDRNWCYR